MSAARSKSRNRATVEYDDMGRIYVKDAALIRRLWEWSLTGQEGMLTVEPRDWNAELRSDFPKGSAHGCYVIIVPPNMGCLCPINIRLRADKNLPVPKRVPAVRKSATRARRAR